MLNRVMFILMTLVIMATTPMVSHAYNDEEIEDYCDIVSDYAGMLTRRYHADGGDSRRFVTTIMPELIKKMDQELIKANGKPISDGEQFQKFNDHLVKTLYSYPRITKHIDAGQEATEVKNAIFVDCMRTSKRSN